MQLIEPVAGRLVVATPLLVDPNFHRSVVLLLNHDDDGTLGVVLDRPTTIQVDEYLPAWADVVADPPVVFMGGPVDPEVGIGVAIRFGSIEVVDLTGDPATDAPVRIFAGYAGWGAGQLEAEIAEEAWFVAESAATDVISDRPDDLWSTVLRRQPGRMAMFASFPPDPRMN